VAELSAWVVVEVVVELVVGALVDSPTGGPPLKEPGPSSTYETTAKTRINMRTRATLPELVPVILEPGN
jgi:hypothetical protein